MAKSQFEMHLRVRSHDAAIRAEIASCRLFVEFRIVFIDHCLQLFVLFVLDDFYKRVVTAKVQATVSCVM